jgi:MFS family permease
VPTHTGDEDRGSTGETASGGDTGEPAPTRKTVRLAMFSSLAERNFRLFASGKVVSNVGTWMQRVAQDWLVLELSGQDPMALGIAAALQFIPVFVLSAWAGVLADRMDKRKLLIVVQVGMGLSGLALGLLNVSGVVALWQVYLLCFVLGCFAACDSPIRQSFVAEMVGPSQMTNAVALNSMVFNLARIAGPAVAGVLIGVMGTGPVFLINAASFVAVIAGLAAMRPAELYSSPRVPRRRGQLVEGLRYVRGRPDIIAVLALVFSVSVFGMSFTPKLANAAANVFHQDASGYGLLSTLLAVGTMTGAALVARRSSQGKPRLRVLIGGSLALGVSEAVTGLMPNYVTFGAMLVVLGAASLTFTTAANVTTQLSVGADMRGRVMGLYMLVFLGSNPIGGPLTAWLASTWGGRAPFVVGGILAAAAAACCGAVLARRGGLAVTPRALVRRRVPAG